MKETAVLDRPLTETTEAEPLWDNSSWERFDQVLDVLARFELYIDECLDAAPGPLMDPWLDEALEIRTASL